MSYQMCLVQRTRLLDKKHPSVIQPTALLRRLRHTNAKLLQFPLHCGSCKVVPDIGGAVGSKTSAERGR